MTKKVPVIFHNLRGYGSHLIFGELKNFDGNIDVIPNGLETYMANFYWQYAIYEFQSWKTSQNSDDLIIFKCFKDILSLKKKTIEFPLLLNL